MLASLQPSNSMSYIGVINSGHEGHNRLDPDYLSGEGVCKSKEIAVVAALLPERQLALEELQCIHDSQTCSILAGVLPLSQLIAQMCT